MSPPFMPNQIKNSEREQGSGERKSGALVFFFLCMSLHPVKAVVGTTSTSGSTLLPHANASSSRLPIPVRVLQEAIINRVVCQVELVTGYVYEGTIESIDENQNIVLLDATVQSVRPNHLRSIRTKGVMQKKYVGTVFLHGAKILLVSMEEVPEGIVTGFRNAVKGVKKEIAQRKMKNRLERRQRLAASAKATSPKDAAGAKKSATISPKDAAARRGSNGRGAGSGRGRGRGRGK